MKEKSILAISITLNGILLALAAYLFLFESPSLRDRTGLSGVAGSGQSVDAGSGYSSETGTEGADGSVSSDGSGVVKKIDWSRIESESFEQYRANLQALGLPKQIIDDILYMDINRQYAQAMKEMQGDKAYEYWKQENFWSGGFNKEKRKAFMEMQKEKNKLFEELTGKSFEEYTGLLYGGYYQYQKRMFGFISEDKMKQIMELERSYNEKRMDIYAENNGMETSLDQEAIQKIEEQKRQALKALMTPEEWEQYQFRTSPTAQRLRGNQAMELTEAEYIALFRIQQAFDEKYQTTSYRNQNLSQEQMQERQKEQAAIDEKIKQTLGPERYEEYKLSQDWRYQNIYSLTKRLDQPKSVALDAYKTVTQFENDLNVLQGNKDLDANAKRAEYEQMKKAFQTKLNNLLTERGASAYLQQQGSHLINRRF